MKTLHDLLAAESQQSVRASIMAIGEAARLRHGDVRAVLFYGSCLRDGDEDEKIADLYLVVGKYRRAHKSLVPALFNWLLPPNVGYIEAVHDGRTVRAKYAVISLRDFERANAGRWFHSYIWARFAQPCRLTFWQSDKDKTRIISALAEAAATVLREVRPLLPERTVAEAFWIRAFRETYRAELRAEKPTRAGEIFAADQPRYEAIWDCLGEISSGGRLWAKWKWAWRRPWGKGLSVARLIKAAFTFENGGTYILWKIERHSGVRVTPSPWQSRHPVLASTVLAWRLYRRGAFK